MKYIITESQYNNLLENKTNKLQIFQDLINDKLEYIKKHCDDYNADNYPNDISFDSCDEVATIENIRVSNMEYSTSLHHPYDESTKKTLIMLHLIIDYDFMKYKSYDNIIWDIKQMLMKSTGLPIDIDFDVNNVRTEFNW
jgi:hypothetical protein